MIGLDLDHLDGVAVARPRGDIDAANATSIQAQLSDALAPHADNLILDLSRTSYVDSAGLDMLFRFSERLRQRRATLRLVIPPRSQLRRLADIVALPRTAPVYDSAELAVTACREERPARAVRAEQPDPGR